MGVTGHAKGDTRWVELDGLRVPEVMIAKATKDGLPFDVDVEAELVKGRMVVRSIRTSRGEITSETLRQIPVAKILSLGVLSLVGTMNLAGTDLMEAGRQGPTEGTLKLVARVYRLAFLGGERPTQAVEKLFGVSRSTAGRWVQYSRREGFLGPATERRAGQLRKGRRSGETAIDPSVAS